MKFITEIILKIFDFFTFKKIMKILKQELSDKQRIILMDVGSHKGEYVESISKDFLIDKAFCFEPNPKVFCFLKDKFQDKNNYVLIDKGVSDIPQNIEFNQNIETSSSSFNELNKNSSYYKKKYFFLNMFNLKKVTEKINIDVIVLDEFFSQKKVGNIDLLKIDTEGFEYKVLLGLKKKLKKIRLIHFEHHFDDMIIKNYKFKDVNNFLLKNHFKKIFKVKMKFRKSFEYIYKNMHLE